MPPVQRCAVYIQLPVQGYSDRISVAAIPDVETVERVERDRQPDAKQLKKEDQRKICQKAHLPGVGVRPADRGGVGNQNVFEQKRAHGNDAGKRMQAAQKKRNTLAGAQRRHA